MNTVLTPTPTNTQQQLTVPQKASVAYGWGILILAGGGAYYFAKRSINADREERAHAEERRRQQRERFRTQEALSRKSALAGEGAADGGRGSGKPAPNAEKPYIGDPAPVTHAQEEMAKRGKYEASEPYRSRRGDRFS